MAKEYYFLAGSVINGNILPCDNEYLDLFKDQKGWNSAVMEKANSNTRFKSLLEIAISNGFSLDPNLGQFPHLIKDPDFMTALILKDNTIYRRVFHEPREVRVLARKMYGAHCLNPKYDTEYSKHVVRDAIVEAAPHEWAHVLWNNFSEGMKKEWHEIVSYADIDRQLELKGYVYDLGEGKYPENLNKEAFCSYLNAYVIPSAKNLSGAKPTPEIVQFFKEQIGIN